MSEDNSILKFTFYQRIYFEAGDEKCNKEGKISVEIKRRLPFKEKSDVSEEGENNQPAVNLLPSDAAQLFFDFLATERLPTRFKVEVVYRTLVNESETFQIRSSDITKCLDDKPISSCRFEKEREPNSFIDKHCEKIFEICYESGIQRAEQESEIKSSEIFKRIKKAAKLFSEQEAEIKSLKICQRIKKAAELFQAKSEFSEKLQWIKKAGRISHEFEVIQIEPGKSFSLKDRMTVERFLPGEYCPMVFPPNFPKTNCVPDHALVIGNSSYTKSNLERNEKVNNAIWDTFEKEVSTLVRINEKGTIILVQGPPGSGKDGLAKAIHFGAVRDAPEKFKAISVAGMSLSDLRSRLFGFEKDGDFIEGLIAQTDGGTLMLDEIDKAAIDAERADFYRMLLRVLESHEYLPENARQPRKISKLCWVLAGAFSEKKESFVAPDFWSRLSHLVRIRNPLDTSLTERRSYAMSLFLWFHFQETASWVNTNSMNWMIGSNDGSVTEKIGKVLLFGDTRDSNKTKPIMPGNVQMDFAEEFSKLILREDGIRAVKQSARAASRSLRASVIAGSGMKFSWPDKKPGPIEEALEKANVTLELNRGNLA
ncbi:MAG: sigma-54 factor interaction domain-containing protein [Proteobacteria bacterium]|nr:sigma-54 factor interaction domain-containing protein [Pseudomonadota bacterium]MBU1060578.1 sigma-54 factor interaction domain-containing protein [Pseudomonadota bacterium]